MLGEENRRTGHKQELDMYHFEEGQECKSTTSGKNYNWQGSATSRGLKKREE